MIFGNYVKSWTSFPRTCVFNRLPNVTDLLASSASYYHWTGGDNVKNVAHNTSFLKDALVCFVRLLHVASRSEITAISCNKQIAAGKLPTVHHSNYTKNQGSRLVYGR